MEQQQRQRLTTTSNSGIYRNTPAGLNFNISYTSTSIRIRTFDFLLILLVCCLACACMRGIDGIFGGRGANPVCRCTVRTIVSPPIIEPHAVPMWCFSMTTNRKCDRQWFASPRAKCIYSSVWTPLRGAAEK